MVFFPLSDYVDVFLIGKYFFAGGGLQSSAQRDVEYKALGCGGFSPSTLTVPQRPPGLTWHCSEESHAAGDQNRADLELAPY